MTTLYLQSQANGFSESGILSAWVRLRAVGSFAGFEDIFLSTFCFLDFTFLVLTPSNSKSESSDSGSISGSGAE